MAFIYVYNSPDCHYKSMILGHLVARRMTKSWVNKNIGKKHNHEYHYYVKNPNPYGIVWVILKRERHTGFSYHKVIISTEHYTYPKKRYNPKKMGVSIHDCSKL